MLSGGSCRQSKQLTIAISTPDLFGSSRYQQARLLTLRALVGAISQNGSADFQAPHLADVIICGLRVGL